MFFWNIPYINIATNSYQFRFSQKKIKVSRKSQLTKLIKEIVDETFRLKLQYSINMVAKRITHHIPYFKTSNNKPLKYTIPTYNWVLLKSRGFTILLQFLKFLSKGTADELKEFK